MLLFLDKENAAVVFCPLVEGAVILAYSLSK